MGSYLEQSQRRRPRYRGCRWYQWEKRWAGQSPPVQAWRKWKLRRPPDRRRPHAETPDEVLPRQREAGDGGDGAPVGQRPLRPGYVELLAKLEGEMSKDAADNPNRISVILLNDQGDQPLDPEVFR